MEDILQAKIGALCVMLLLAFLAGLTPIKVRRLLMSSTLIPEKYTLIFLSCSLCFGAGVLMATVFLHILKETRESFNNAMEKGIIGESVYAIPELLMCAGFFLIYFLEEVVHFWVHQSHDRRCQKSQEGGGENDHFRRVSSIRLRTSLRRCNSLESAKCCEGKSEPSHDDTHEYMKKQNEEGIDKKYKVVSNNNKPVGMPTEKVKVATYNSSEMKVKEESIIRTILVILALSLHGAFEGLSLGLEGSSEDVWLLCVALSAHKIFIAFSIGMELLEEGINLALFVLHMIIFSLASPIGGVVGMTLTASLSDTTVGIIIITVLKGISGGTILYVTFCEVLERERTKTTGRFLRLLALVVGFSVMAGLEAAAGEHHHVENLVFDNSLNVSIAHT